MSTFYTNFAVSLSNQKAVIQAIRAQKRDAYVSEPFGNYIFVYERESDSQDDSIIKEVGSALSKRLSTPVLAVMNHDDDVICYWLFVGGEVADSYNSDPGYFNETDEEQGGNATLLASSFHVPKMSGQIENILRSQEYDFAQDRHEALAAALDIPFVPSSIGFGDIDIGDLPDDLSEDDFTVVESE